MGNQERIDWVMIAAFEHRIRVNLAGRIGSFYEAARKRFEAAGLTGDGRVVHGHLPQRR